VLEGNKVQAEELLQTLMSLKETESTIDKVKRETKEMKLRKKSSEFKAVTPMPFHTLEQDSSFLEGVKQVLVRNKKRPKPDLHALKLLEEAKRKAPFSKTLTREKREKLLSPFNESLKHPPIGHYRPNFESVKPAIHVKQFRSQL